MKMFVQDQKSFLMGQCSLAQQSRFNEDYFNGVKKLTNFDVQIDGSIRPRQSFKELYPLPDVPNRDVWVFKELCIYKKEDKAFIKINAADIELVFDLYNYKEYSNNVWTDLPVNFNKPNFPRVFKQPENLIRVKKIKDTYFLFFESGIFFKLHLNQTGGFYLYPSYMNKDTKNNIEHIEKAFPFFGLNKKEDQRLHVSKLDLTANTCDINVLGSETRDLIGHPIICNPKAFNLDVGLLRVKAAGTNRRGVVTNTLLDFASVEADYERTYIPGTVQEVEEGGTDPPTQEEDNSFTPTPVNNLVLNKTDFNKLTQAGPSSSTNGESIPIDYFAVKSRNAGSEYDNLPFKDFFFGQTENPQITPKRSNYVLRYLTRYLEDNLTVRFPFAFYIRFEKDTANFRYIIDYRIYFPTYLRGEILKYFDTSIGSFRPSHRFVDVQELNENVAYMNINEIKSAIFNLETLESFTSDNVIFFNNSDGVLQTILSLMRTSSDSLNRVQEFQYGQDTVSNSWDFLEDFPPSPVSPDTTVIRTQSQDFVEERVEFSSTEAENLVRRLFNRVIGNIGYHLNHINNEKTFYSYAQFFRQINQDEPDEEPEYSSSETFDTEPGVNYRQTIKRGTVFKIGAVVSNDYFYQMFQSLLDRFYFIVPVMKKADGGYVCYVHSFGEKKLETYQTEFVTKNFFIDDFEEGYPIDVEEFGEKHFYSTENCRFVFSEFKRDDVLSNPIKSLVNSRNIQGLLYNSQQYPGINRAYLIDGHSLYEEFIDDIQKKGIDFTLLDSLGFSIPEEKLKTATIHSLTAQGGKFVKVYAFTDQGVHQLSISGVNAQIQKISNFVLADNFEPIEVDEFLILTDGEVLYTANLNNSNNSSFIYKHDGLASRAELGDKIFKCSNIHNKTFLVHSENGLFRFFILNGKILGCSEYKYKNFSVQDIISNGAVFNNVLYELKQSEEDIDCLMRMFPFSISHLYPAHGYYYVRSLQYMYIFKDKQLTNIKVGNSKSSLSLEKYDQDQNPIQKELQKFEIGEIYKDDDFFQLSYTYKSDEQRRKIYGLSFALQSQGDI